MSDKLDIEPCRHKVNKNSSWLSNSANLHARLKTNQSSDHFHQHDAAQSQRGSTQVRTLLLCRRERIPDPAGSSDCDLRPLDVIGQTYGHFKVNY
jgi:hypothetical protein